MGATALLGRMPKRGYRTNGNIAVTAIGTASEIHQSAISRTTAAMRCPSGDTPSGGGRISMNKNRRMPPTMRTNFFWIKFLKSFTFSTLPKRSEARYDQFQFR